MTAEAIAATHEARKAAAEADLAELDLARRREEREYREAVRRRIAEHTGAQVVNPRLIDEYIDAEVLPALRLLGEAGIVGIEPVERADLSSDPVG